MQGVEKRAGRCAGQSARRLKRSQGRLIRLSQCRGDVEPPDISFCSRLLGGWRYEIETSEWNEVDDTRSEVRPYRTLRKFVVEEEVVLTAEMCHWDVMQIDRDAEIQAAEIFRSFDLDSDGHLDRDEMRKALAKLHGICRPTPQQPPE